MPTLLPVRPLNGQPHPAADHPYGEWGTRKLDHFLEKPKDRIEKKPLQTYKLIGSLLTNENVSQELRLRIASATRCLFSFNNRHLQGWREFQNVLVPLLNQTEFSKETDQLCATLILNGAPLTEEIIRFLCANEAEHSLKAAIVSKQIPRSAKMLLLDQAAIKGDRLRFFALFEQLTNSGTTVQEGKDSPLILLCRKKHALLAEEFLRRFPEEAKPAHRGVEGNTALHWAVAGGLDSVISILLDLNPGSQRVQNANNHLPLHFYLCLPKDQQQLPLETLRRLTVAPSLDATFYQLIAISDATHLEAVLMNNLHKLRVGYARRGALFASLNANEKMVLFFLNKILNWETPPSFPRPYLAFLLQNCVLQGMQESVAYLSQHPSTSEISKEILNTQGTDLFILANRFYHTELLSLLKEQGASFPNRSPGEKTPLHDLASLSQESSSQPSFPANWQSLFNKLWTMDLTKEEENSLIAPGLSIAGRSRLRLSPQEKELHFDQLDSIASPDEMADWLEARNLEGEKPIQQALREGDTQLANWLLDQMHVSTPQTPEQWAERLSFAFSLGRTELLQDLLEHPDCIVDFSSVHCYATQNALWHFPQIAPILIKLVEGGMPLRQEPQGFLFLKLDEDERRVFLEGLLGGPYKEKALQQLSLHSIRLLIGASSSAYLDAWHAATLEKRLEDLPLHWPDEEFLVVASMALNTPNSPLMPLFSEEIIIKKSSSHPHLAANLIEHIEGAAEKNRWALFFSTRLEPGKHDLSFLYDLGLIPTDTTLMIQQSGREHAPIVYKICKKWMGDQSEKLSEILSSSEEKVDLSIQADPSYFPDILRYLYGGTIKIDHDNFKPLLSIARELQIPKLIHELENWISARHERIYNKQKYLKV